MLPIAITPLDVGASLALILLFALVIHNWLDWSYGPDDDDEDDFEDDGGGLGRR